MEVNGIWWIPEDSGQKSVGCCTATNESFIFEVQGDENLGPVLADCQMDQHIQTIFGKLQDGSFCTLENCHYIGGSYGTGGLSIKKFKVETIIHGIHCNINKSESFTACKFSFNNLARWMKIEPFNIDHIDNIRRVNFIDKDLNEFKISALNMHLKFSYVIKSIKTTSQELKALCVPFIAITAKQPVTASHFIDICNKTNWLLTLLSGVQFCCSSFEVKRADSPTNHIQEKQWVKIESFALDNFLSEIEQAKRPIFLSKIAIEDSLSTIFNRYFERIKRYKNTVHAFVNCLDFTIDEKWIFLKVVHIVEDIYRLFFHGKYISDQRYNNLKSKLSHLCSEVTNETLKEKFKIILSNGNKPSLDEMINELISYSWSIGQRFIDDVDAFSKNTASMRNALSHGKDPKNNIQLEGFSFIKASRSLKLLIGYRLLLDIGISNELLIDRFTKAPIPPYI